MIPLVSRFIGSHDPSGMLRRGFERIEQLEIMRSVNPEIVEAVSRYVKRHEPAEIYRRALEHVEDEEIRQAVACFRKAAEAGHVEAQRRLAECYHFGKGVTRSLPDAVGWYTKAAEAENTEFAAPAWLHLPRRIPLVAVARPRRGLAPASQLRGSGRGDG